MAEMHSKRARARNVQEWFDQRKEARAAKKAPPSLAQLPAPWQVIRLAFRLAGKTKIHAGVAWLLTRPQAWKERSLLFRFGTCIVVIVASLQSVGLLKQRPHSLNDPAFVKSLELFQNAAEACPMSAGLAIAIETLNDRGESLQHGDLSSCQLNDVKLPGVELHGARLHHIDMSDAQLVNADLTKVYAVKASFARANLSGANLTEANLSLADLSEADLANATLERTDLSLADLRSTKLDWGELANADLYRSDLTNASLANTNLTGADLRRAVLKGARVEGSTIEQAEFCETVMPDGMLCDRDCGAPTPTGCTWFARF